ncbi:hypothetical protein [Altererythrobacter lauratis]|uniref:META domain-containing protein n=1 Tax=Alteraurantiacibacter lauratis TaxID=2054627 RepID=A0ABV7EF59_9SPHN
MPARPAFAALLFLLTACSQDAPPAPLASESTERPTAAPLAEIASLEGEWRVAGIDGEPLNETYGIALSASMAEIWAEPRCAGMVLGYRIDGQWFTSAPPMPENPQPVPDAPTPPVCAGAVPPRMADVFTALRHADTIGRTPANGVELSGGGYSVLLFSQ